MLPIALLTSLTLLPSLATALAQCYLRNGKPAPSSYSPCNTNATGQTGSHTHCCDWANGDICLSSGLCLYPSGSVVGMFNADGCTDKTMQDASCFPQCKDHTVDYLRVVPCEDGTWCCTSGYDTKCCSASGRFSLNGLGSLTNVTSPETATMGAMGTRTLTVQQGTCTAATTAIVKANATGSVSATATPSVQQVSTNDGHSVGVDLGLVLLGGLSVVGFGAV
jgi:hypothetical protein